MTDTNYDAKTDKYVVLIWKHIITVFEDFNL